MNILPKILNQSIMGALSLLAVLTSSQTAHAVIGTLDRVPAATLLLPYFEDDLGDPNGTQTRFTVTNATATPTLAHVVLWTDMGVPTFSFDLYVGGFDSEQVDLRLLFAGVLPQTSSSAFPAGPDSSTHGAVNGCPLSASAMYAGMPIPDQLTAAQIAHLQAAHQGMPSATFGGMCSAANHGDAVARGYITIDATNECSSKFPSDAGYFVDGGAGVASNVNALFGTYTAIERGNNVTAASPLVSIEADNSNPITNTGNSNYTFYAAFNTGGADNREPLGTVWQARNLDVAFFDPGTDLIVWRDPALAHSAFVCGTVPADFPRQQTEVVAFDEQEHPTILTSNINYPNPQPGPLTTFPLLAQRVAASVMSPYSSGFIHLNLNTTVPGSNASSIGLLQSYVAVRQQMNGKFGAALPATYLWGPQYQVVGPNNANGGPTSCTGPTAPNFTATYPSCDFRPAIVGD